MEIPSNNKSNKSHEPGYFIYLNDLFLSHNINSKTITALPPKQMMCLSSFFLRLFHELEVLNYI